MKEILGYRVYALAGIPTLRTCFARVTVNGRRLRPLRGGRDPPDDRFLDRNYDDPTGNLYDGKYDLVRDGQLHAARLRATAWTTCSSSRRAPTSATPTSTASPTHHREGAAPTFYDELGRGGRLGRRSIAAHRGRAVGRPHGRLLAQHEQLPGVLRPDGRARRAARPGTSTTPSSRTTSGASRGAPRADPRRQLLRGRELPGRAAAGHRDAPSPPSTPRRCGPASMRGTR